MRAVTVDPYQPPTAEPYGGPDTAPGEPPKVVFWFKMYAGLMAFMFALVTIAGIVMLAAPLGLPEEDGVPVAILGGVYLMMGLMFLGATLVPFFAGQRSWAWVYNLILIALGMTSCTIVFSIPLLIYWIKPETREYYGQS